MTFSNDLFTRHGSILAAAELVHALYLHGNTKHKYVLIVVCLDIVCRDMHNLNSQNDLCCGVSISDQLLMSSLRSASQT